MGRALSALVLCCLGACAAAPQPVALDPDPWCRLTLQGFREASPFVAARLDAACAWAVFPDVEDLEASGAGEACAHEGLLYRRGSDEPRPVVLTCAVRPGAPAGTVAHVLVILEEPADLVLLERRLDLSDAPHLAPHDLHEVPDAPATRWVVTSVRAGLLFDDGTAFRVRTLTHGSSGAR